MSGEREPRALRAPAGRAAPLPAPRAYCPGEPAQLGKNPPGRYHPGAPRSQLKVSWHDEGRFTYTEGRRHDTAHAGQAEAALRPQPRPKLRRVRCLSRRLPPEQENHQPATQESERAPTPNRPKAHRRRRKKSPESNKEQQRSDTKLASPHQASDQTKKTAAPRRRGGRGAPKRNAVVVVRERDCKQQHT